MTPITTLPCMMKRPNDSITWPAAAGPSWPWPRISRVEARLSASRSMVAISSTVGKALNSSGFSMNSAVSRISTEKRDRQREQQIEQEAPAAAGSGRPGSRARRRASSDVALPRAPAASCGSRLLCSPPALPSCRAAYARPGRRCRPAGGGTGRPSPPYCAQLVAQRADRDPQDGGRVGPVASVWRSVSTIRTRSTSATVRPTRRARVGADPLRRSRRACRAGA